MKDRLQAVFSNFGNFSEPFTATTIDMTTLTDDQIVTFEDAAATIKNVSTSDIDSINSVVAILINARNVFVIDDLATNDGASLNGAAGLDTVQVLIDSSPGWLRSAGDGFEEVAETAYQSVSGKASSRNFSAQVLARTLGKTNRAALDQFAASALADVFETIYRTIQALNDAGVQQVVDASTAVFEIQNIEVNSLEYE